MSVAGELARPLLVRGKRDGIIAAGISPADLATGAVDSLFLAAGLNPTSERAAIDPGDGVRRKDVDRVFRFVRRVLRDSLVDFQSKTLDESFLRDSEDLLKEAALGRWGRERFIDAVDELAGSYGEGNFRRSYAATWHRTIVLNASYAKALRLAYSSRPTSNLFPFLAIRTVPAENRRDNHFALEGFVAASTWDGWDEWLPPYGWNCKCRPAPVSYVVARALGWIGKAFPRGTKYLRPRMVNGRRVTPGRDPGFVEPLSNLQGLAPR